MSNNMQNAAFAASDEQNIKFNAQSYYAAPAANPTALAAGVYQAANAAPTANAARLAGNFAGKSAGISVRSRYKEVFAKKLNWRMCRSSQDGTASTRSLITFLDENGDAIEWFTVSATVTAEIAALDAQQFASPEAKQAALRTLVFGKHIMQTTNRNGEAYNVIGNSISLEGGITF